MSRARHKLTGIRHNAIHNSAKTYQDETSGGPEDVIIIPQIGEAGWGEDDLGADGDSYIYHYYRMSDGDVDDGEGQLDHGSDRAPWHDSFRFLVGSHYKRQHDRIYTYRTLWNANLFDGTQLDENTVIKNAVLTITFQYGFGGILPGADGGEMNTVLCNIYRNRQTLPDDIDVTYSWWQNWGVDEPWGTSGASNTTTDIDTSVSASFYLRPGTWFAGDGGPQWDVDDQVDINITELVQDAVTNRNGLLKTIWIKEDDMTIDDLTAHQNTGCFFSGNSNWVSRYPTLRIWVQNP